MLYEGKIETLTKLLHCRVQRLSGKIVDRFPNGSIGDLDAEVEQLMPCPKGIETEPNPIAHWKTSQ